MYCEIYNVCRSKMYDNNSPKVSRDKIEVQYYKILTVHLQTQKVAVIEEMRDQKNGTQEANSKMAKITPSLSVITLNENRLNLPIKKQR